MGQLRNGRSVSDRKAARAIVLGAMGRQGSFSAGAGVEVTGPHIDHTSRWPPGITPPAATRLHQRLGRTPLAVLVRTKRAATALARIDAPDHIARGGRVALGLTSPPGDRTFWLAGARGFAEGS